ncbi:MAG: hypothetical protein IJ009_02560 [Clostridia bacterium]|nr:hypothetical protein [Clostridia bacterium]
MNVKNFSKEIKKDLKETHRNSTETITIRVTSDEKKRVKRLAKACKLSQTQLVKKLIQGADLKAIPPSQIYEIGKELSEIREIILEYCLEGEPVRAYVAAIQKMMNTFFEHCKLFYDEGIFGAAFEKYYRDLDENEVS